LDTGSFGTKEILFHLASELLLHICKMLLLLVLVVLKGYLRNLRGSREPMQKKAKASFTGPWGLEGISTQFARGEPISRKGIHLSAANTKWRILTHSVSGVVCDLLCARVTAENKLEGSQKCVGESLTH